MGQSVHLHHRTGWHGRDDADPQLKIGSGLQHVVSALGGKQGQGKRRDVSTQDKTGTLRLARVGKELRFYAAASGQPQKEIGTVDFGDRPIDKVAFQVFTPASKAPIDIEFDNIRSKPIVSPSWSMFPRPETALFGFSLDSLSSHSFCSPAGGFSGGAVETGVDDALPARTPGNSDGFSNEWIRCVAIQDVKNHPTRSDPAPFVASRNHKLKAPNLVIIGPVPLSPIFQTARRDIRPTAWSRLARRYASTSARTSESKMAENGAFSKAKLAICPYLEPGFLNISP